MTLRVRQLPTRGSVALLIVVMALFVVACGDDDETGANDTGGTPSASAENGLEEAQKLVDEFSGPAEFAPEGEPIDVAELRGETGAIHLIAPTLGIPFVQVVSDAFEDAGRTAGVEAVVFDGQNDISQMQRGIEEAIQQDAGAIVLFSLDPVAFAGPLEKAEEAGIPVVSANNGDPDDPLDEGTDANATYSYTEAGNVMAAYAAVRSECDVNAHVITVSEYRSTKNVAAGFKESLESFCPDAEVAESDARVATLDSEIPSLTKTLISRNPDLNWFAPSIDVIGNFIAPSIRQLGKQDSIHIVSENGALDPNLRWVKKGDVQLGTVGQNNRGLGWAFYDQGLRLAAGAEPADQNIPQKLFTVENLADVPASALEDQDELWGVITKGGKSTAYEDAYREQWSMPEVTE